MAAGRLLDRQRRRGHLQWTGQAVRPRPARRPLGEVHGDLHWNNLLVPDFALVDWELWGRGPAGLDAATLYLHSLLVPETARRTREPFTDLLSTPTGKTAQIYAAARLLSRADRDYPDLADPLRRHIEPLLAADSL